MSAAMDRKIFNMELDVAAVSTYILCCALKDAGTKVSLNTLKERWNGHFKDLEKGLVELEEKNILIKSMESGQDGHQEYALLKSSVWG